MKLTKCVPYVIEVPFPHRGGDVYTFIKLETDEGIVGWGETCAQHTFYHNYRLYPQFMEMLFDEYLKGEDALARERLMKKMYLHFLTAHPDFLVSCMFSAIDIALWDIAGKAANLPVYQLLGGKYRDKIRSYSYIFDDVDFIDGEELWTKRIDDTVKCAMRYVERGYTALKYDPLPTHFGRYDRITPWELSNRELDFAEESVSTLRAALGRDVDIIIGTHGQTTPASSIRFGTMLEKYDVLWFEEPVPPENTEEMGRVVRGVKVPVATGERLCFTYEFERLFRDAAPAIAQPDLGSVGGITETKKISAMAEPKYIQVAPHVWGGPVSLAAAIQIDTTIPNFLIQETVSDGGGFYNEIVDEPITWEKGYLLPLERPGIGVNLKEDALKRLSLL